MTFLVRALLKGGVVLLGSLSSGQQTPVRVPGTAAIEPAWTQPLPGVWRSEGEDAWSGVRYVRISVLGGEATAGTERPDSTKPTLMGQCTQDSAGKLHFELFANFGGVMDSGFYPPWHSTGPDEVFPPRTNKVMLTMEFLGYTKVKPFKRQFEEVTAPGPEQLRYMNPGNGSANMEAPGWFFQYLRALPTLRLSGSGHIAEFSTTGWLAQLHKEPLCGASGA